MSCITFCRDLEVEFFDPKNEDGLDYNFTELFCNGEHIEGCHIIKYKDDKIDLKTNDGRIFRHIPLNALDIKNDC